MLVAAPAHHGASLHERTRRLVRCGDRYRVPREGRRLRKIRFEEPGVSGSTELAARVVTRTLHGSVRETYAGVSPRDGDLLRVRRSLRDNRGRKDGKARQPRPGRADLARAPAIQDAVHDAARMSDALGVGAWGWTRPRGIVDGPRGDGEARDRADGKCSGEQVGARRGDSPRDTSFDACNGTPARQGTIVVDGERGVRSSRRSHGSRRRSRRTIELRRATKGDFAGAPELTPLVVAPAPHVAGGEYGAGAPLTDIDARSVARQSNG